MNRLINETSPYLLQHAHNPVDWYPWGEEALQRARQEDKPILVSIGYSACHWCHVMERESFENEATAGFMNGHFVNIKIDREERPDLDHIYMDAVQAMSGSGGWPLNVFLTPDAKPFYGGTYFPPQPIYNRPSWMDVLQGVAHAFAEKREEIGAQAEQLTAHLLQSNAFGQDAPGAAPFFDRESLERITQAILKTGDKAYGGFGQAPKFPQTGCIQYLLRYYHFYKDEAALQQALLSLDKMLYGGIYDQAGGGFARYATDTRWLVPHFEKMLYDNALLVSVLSEAYQLTHLPQYKRVVEETMAFAVREMLSPEGGFYAALDADSEGEEGKFYVWQKKEIDVLLGDDAPLFCAYYDVTDGGNWEGKNILHVPVAPATFAAAHGVTEEALEAKLAAGRARLLEYRAGRVRPGLDDKILLGWNALMNTACSKAFAATGDESYRALAIRNMRFLLQQFANGPLFFHTWKKNTARHPAFLDDYAYLIQALLHLQEITGDAAWLTEAKRITEQVTGDFSEEGTVFFFFTGSAQEDVIIRKKEIYDGATPSGNSVMAGNLLYLSSVFDNGDWRRRAAAMVFSLRSTVTHYPTSFAGWANLFLVLARGQREVVVTGKNFASVHVDILHNFMPGTVLQLSAYPGSAYPLLEGKQFNDFPLIYLCENYACRPPVASLSELIQLIEN